TPIPRSAPSCGCRRRRTHHWPAWLPGSSRPAPPSGEASAGRRVDRHATVVVFRSGARLLGRETSTEPRRLAGRRTTRGVFGGTVRPRLRPWLPAGEREPEDGSVHHQPLLAEPARVV